VGVGVERGWRVVWVGCGALLGPEVSAVGLVLLGLLGGFVPVWCGFVLVGWLFVNWIVDASICDVFVTLLFGVWGCRVFCSAGRPWWSAGVVLSL